MARNRDIDDPRRRVLIQALSMGAFSGTALDAWAQSLFGSRPGKLPPGRSIHRLTGQVTVNEQPATLETRINPGDTVKTLTADSEVIFVVGTQAMILRGMSTMTLEKAQEGPSLIVRGLRLLRGAVLSVSRNQRLSVGTLSASIGIRGTGFYVEAEPDQTYFCTCYGVTDVAAVDDPQSRETISATHHDRPVWIVKDAPAGRRIRNAPFINHTDQELALIEALVGREPPFVFPKDSYGGPRRDY